MPITSEQADQVKDIILKTLDTHHKGNLPYREVWTKAPAEDFDGVDFLDVWVIYDGKPHIVDAGLGNSYSSFLYQTMLDVGIRAQPSVSYIPQSDADELGKEWLMAGW